MARFPQEVKPRLGFEAVATRGWDAVRSPVHGVECAYLGLPLSPPGGSAAVQRLGDTQRPLHHVLANNATRRVLQKWTQIGGVQR